jgi:renalase
MSKIAIVGAGISGLVLAEKLKNISNVTVFEKSKGIGGRIATRYTDDFQFDHGTQFFTVKSAEFKDYLAPIKDAGIIDSWNAKFVEIADGTINITRQWSDDKPHYVATPKMNALGKHIASKVGLENIKLNTKVTTITKQGERWSLAEDDSYLGEFDWVILATPNLQAAELMPQCFYASSTLQTQIMTGCYALMLGFHKPLELPWDAALVKGADISWISVNSSKPKRNSSYSIVVNATNAWSEKNMEQDITTVQAYLLEQFAKVTQIPLPTVQQADYINTHRWRYANMPPRDEKIVLLDTNNHLAACGDWCIQGRVEAAFMSATKLANKLEDHLANS